MKTTEAVLAATRAWKARNIDKVRAYSRKWAKDNAARMRANRKRHYYKDVAKSRLRLQLARYGMTTDEYQAMLLSQSGLCAICRTAKPTHFDHDHETKRVRGILCNPCNLGIGWLKDNAERCRLAAVYLSR